MKRIAFVGAAALFLLYGLDTRFADADRGSYLFYYREPLAAHLEDHVGELVQVTDEVVAVYEHQQVRGYRRFDTRYFRCAVPEQATASNRYLASLFPEEPPRTPAQGAQAPDRVARPRLATLWARVARPEFYGPVSGAGAGVATESIILVCDEVTEPRARWYDEIH